MTSLTPRTTLPPTRSRVDETLGSTPPTTNDEFASVLSTKHGSSCHTTTPTTAPSSHVSQSALTDQQLYDRIEEQLEHLDKKRLQLQQLLRQWHDTPYSSRIARSVESTRVDSARLAKKVHNLFKFIHTPAITSTLPTTTTPDAATSADADRKLLKFQPLFENYAAVSQILNHVCMESIEFEHELSKRPSSGSSSHRSSIDSNPSSIGRRRTPAKDIPSHTHSTTTSTSSSRSSPVTQDNDFSLTSFSAPEHDSFLPTSGSTQLFDTSSSSSDTLPLLQVNGLDAYEADQKRGDFMNLQSMVIDIAHSFQTLQAITTQQQEMINEAQKGVEASKEKALAGEMEIRKASRYKAMGLIFAGGATGAAIGGPIGALVGLKTGLTVGVGIGLIGGAGAILGAVAGKTIQKARLVPLSHLDQEQELQLLQKEKEAEEKEKELQRKSSSSSSTPTTRSSSVNNSSADKRHCSSIRKCL